MALSWKTALLALPMFAAGGLPQCSREPPPPGAEESPIVQWSAADGGNGHYYQAVVMPFGVNYGAADHYAQARGGYLASIGTEAENRFVFRLIDEPKFWFNYGYGRSLGPWLGGTQTPGAAEPGDGWQWSSDAGPFAYVNWEAGQPDDNMGGEQYLHYYSSKRDTRAATWNDTAGDRTVHGFVIEYENNPVFDAARLTIPGAVIAGFLAVSLALVWLSRRRPSAGGGAIP